MNKRASTLTTWIFTISLLLLTILVVQTQIINPMNDIYNKTYQTGMNTSGLQDLENLKTNTDAELQGSEASQTSEGLTLKSSWTIGRSIYQTIVDFIGGNFIHHLIVDVLDLPEEVANVLVVLIWISLILIIIYIFMKVVP